MFDIKIIFLKNESPFCQLPHELIKLHEPFQWLVICDQNEWATKHIIWNVATTHMDAKHSPLYSYELYLTFAWLLE
jgi:hypothetical protein